MKKLIILLILLISLTTPLFILAQGEVEEKQLTTNTQYFDITMERIGQSAWNKAVTYEIYVTPKLDSPQTQIVWDSSSAIDITPKHNEFVDLYKNQTYTFRAKVKTKRSGNYEITANLIAWKHDTNYTSTVSDIITFDQNFLAQPLDPSYNFNLIAKYLIILLPFGAFIFALIVYGKKGMKKLKIWLTPPN